MSFERAGVPVGRHTPPQPDGDDEPEAPRTTPADTSGSTAPPPTKAVAPEPLETELDRQRRAQARTEALVPLMKQMATEMRSLRRDVDQIKSVIAKLGRLAEAKRRAGGSSPASTPPTI